MPCCVVCARKDSIVIRDTTAAHRMLVKKHLYQTLWPRSFTIMFNWKDLVLDFACECACVSASRGYP